MLAYVELARRFLPNPRPETLLAADSDLHKAIEIGPPIAPIWAARAYIAEVREQEDIAVDHWLKAADLLVDNTLTSPLARVAPDLACDIEEATATYDLAPARPAEERERAALIARNMASWMFAPKRREMYVRALKEVEPRDWCALVAALWLARDRDHVALAKKAIELLFKRLRESDEELRPTLRLAMILQNHEAASPEVRALAQEVSRMAVDEFLERFNRAAREHADAEPQWTKSPREMTGYDGGDGAEEREREGHVDVGPLAELIRRRQEVESMFRQLERLEEAHAELIRLWTEAKDIEQRGKTGRWTEEDVTRIRALSSEIHAALGHYEEVRDEGRSLDASI